jgi:hypothetical protein
MNMIDKIPSFDDTKLAAIEVNANRLAKTGTDAQKDHAKHVLLAISVERTRRKQDRAERCRQQADVIADRVRDKDLHERVLMAFTEMPPQEWEVEVLREIASHPGADGTTIARGIGKHDVGYVNLAVGTLCSNREPYLGTAPVLERRKGEKTYSALLIEFTPRAELDGPRRFGWTLKAEAYAALKKLRIVE